MTDEDHILSARVEREVRQLIGELQMQIIVLRAALAAKGQHPQQPEPSKPEPIPPQPEPDEPKPPVEEPPPKHALNGHARDQRR